MLIEKLANGIDDCAVVKGPLMNSIYMFYVRYSVKSFLFIKP